MNICLFKDRHADILFDYWNRIGQDIPYFFYTDKEKWLRSLLDDKLENEKKFKHLETYIAVEDDKVVGFIQFGQPNFHFDSEGKKYYNPDIGVIRHLYYDEDKPEVGRELINKAEKYLKGFKDTYVFYHILGMSCNAHHGKLYNKMFYIEKLLNDHGFSIEHENIYYVLDIERVNVAKDNSSVSIETDDGNNFRAILNNETVGYAEVRHLKDLASVDDTAYLVWIVVNKRHCGIGSSFMNRLVEYLADKGYRYLHTDTAKSNIIAQKYYERKGFINMGLTRSYQRIK
jgi:GNAT superfamily N-acetyltransferase